MAVNIILVACVVLGWATLLPVLYGMERKLMSVNEVLAQIKDNLSEASAELIGKIDELQAQLAASETVDPVLLDEVKALAEGLANVVESEGEVSEEGA